MEETERLMIHGLLEVIGFNARYRIEPLLEKFGYVPLWKQRDAARDRFVEYMWTHHGEQLSVEVRASFPLMGDEFVEMHVRDRFVKIFYLAFSEIQTQGLIKY